MGDDAERPLLLPRKQIDRLYTGWRSTRPSPAKPIAINVAFYYNARGDAVFN